MGTMKAAFIIAALVCVASVTSEHHPGGEDPSLGSQEFPQSDTQSEFTEATEAPSNRRAQKTFTENPDAIRPEAPPKTHPANHRSMYPAVQTAKQLPPDEDLTQVDAEWFGRRRRRWWRV